MSATISSLLPTESEFADFQALILDKIGIFLPESKKSLLMNRLWKRLVEYQFTNYRDYYCFIVSKKGKEELSQALELITTNETYFFREQKHFNYMAEALIPKFKSKDTLRIWSAAASTGEEPYSIAMVLADRCHANWELIGSDVNTKVIEKAKTGIYPEERVENIPELFLHRFFEKGTGPMANYVRIVPELRARVQFLNINLNKSITDNIGKFDLIFLRNILIYFDDSVKKRVLDRISDRLNPGGILFVGHSDSLHGLTNRYSQIAPAIYQIQS